MKFLLSSFAISFHSWLGFSFSFTFCLFIFWNLVFHMEGLVMDQQFERDFSADFLSNIVGPSFQGFCFSSLIQFGSFKLLLLYFSPVKLLLFCLGSVPLCSDLENVFKENVDECGTHVSFSQRL